MRRRPRVILPGVPMHVIQRGNNRQVFFCSNDDYRFYLDWLGEYAAMTGCSVHAYVLMTNQVHLLLSSDSASGVGDLMKALGQCYVQYINRTYRRSGALWEGRFRSCLLQDGAYLLACQRYIELNPVRAAMVEHPADYPWSSARANLLGEENRLITQPPLCLALGGDPTCRIQACRELFRHELELGILDGIRHATNGNFALGNAALCGGGYGCSREMGAARCVWPTKEAGNGGELELVRVRERPGPGETVACPLFSGNVRVPGMAVR